MEIIGFCHYCGKNFDAHWSNYPKERRAACIKKPYCLNCGSHDTHHIIDEINIGPDDWVFAEEE